MLYDLEEELHGPLILELSRIQLFFQKIAHGRVRHTNAEAEIAEDT